MPNSPAQSAWHLKTSLKSTIFKVLQNRQFSTDRDETLTRHDFKLWFIRVLNIKALAQLLHTQLACTKYPISSGTDRRTDRRTSSTLYPLVFTGDNYHSLFMYTTLIHIHVNLNYRWLHRQLVLTRLSMP